MPTVISDEGLLYIEPLRPASSLPVIDPITRKMTAAFRKSQPQGYFWCGFHQCECGAISTNDEYLLLNGEQTNSLCIHYVAHHREEVPADQLAKIDAFAYGEMEPSEGELQGPAFVIEHRLREPLGEDDLSEFLIATEVPKRGGLLQFLRRLLRRS